MKASLEMFTIVFLSVIGFSFVADLITADSTLRVLMMATVAGAVSYSVARWQGKRARGD